LTVAKMNKNVRKSFGTQVYWMKSLTH